MRVADYAATWLATAQPTVRPQTLTSYRSILTRELLPHLGAVELGALTRADVRGWLAALLSAGLAPQTVARAHSVLHALLNVAIDDGLLTVNVSQGLARRLHRSVRPRTTLDLEQLDLFLDTARTFTPRRYPLFVSLCAAGLRIGEAIALRPEDVHPTEPRISILRSVRSGGHVGPTKSGNARHVLITAQAAGILRAVVPSPEGWMFPSRRGPMPMSAHAVRKMTQRIAAQAGLPAITPKTFRRSYASVLKSIGASTAYTAEALGHASEATTVRFYLDGSARAEPPPLLRPHGSGRVR